MVLPGIETELFMLLTGIRDVGMVYLFAQKPAGFCIVKYLCLLWLLFCFRRNVVMERFVT